MDKKVGIKTSKDQISDDLFDEILIEIINETPASALINIPGVYEILAEELNNEVLKRIEERR